MSEQAHRIVAEQRDLEVGYCGFRNINSCYNGDWVASVMLRNSNRRLASTQEFLNSLVWHWVYHLQHDHAPINLVDIDWMVQSCTLQIGHASTDKLCGSFTPVLLELLCELYCMSHSNFSLGLTF